MKKIEPALRVALLLAFCHHFQALIQSLVAQDFCYVEIMIDIWALYGEIESTTTFVTGT